MKFVLHSIDDTQVNLTFQSIESMNHFIRGYLTGYEAGKYEPVAVTYEVKI